MRHGAEVYLSRWTISRPAPVYGFFAHRNPVSPWSVGEIRLRFAERMAFGLLYQEPPRITLVPPDEGPIGFFDGLFL